MLCPSSLQQVHGTFCRDESDCVPVNLHQPQQRGRNRTVPAVCGLYPLTKAAGRSNNRPAACCCIQCKKTYCLQEAAPNDCGVLALRLLIEPAPSPAAAQATVECAALHYSKSMGIAWSSPSSPIPQCQILRQQPSDATRQQMVCAGCFTTFTLPQHH